jgi:hypothetical protein
MTAQLDIQKDDINRAFRNPFLGLSKIGRLSDHLNGWF